MKNKNYAISKAETNEVHYTEIRIPTNEFKIYGEAFVELWGGGEGSIEMDEDCFTADKLTKAVMYANLNDGQFGVETITGGRVWVEQKIKIRQFHIGENNIPFECNPNGIYIWESVVEDLEINRDEDFDAKVGDPLKGIPYTNKTKKKERK